MIYYLAGDLNRTESHVDVKPFGSEFNGTALLPASPACLRLLPDGPGQYVVVGTRQTKGADAKNANDTCGVRRGRARWCLKDAEGFPGYCYNARLEFLGVWIVSKLVLYAS